MAPEESEKMKIDVENWNPETWQEILNISKPLVEFLEKDSYFDAKFNNTDEDKFYVINDAKLAAEIMTDKDCEEYDDWEVFPFSEEVFPSGYENIYRIEVKLDKINYFNLEKKQCSIYHARPMQCRTFPFWDYFKENEEEVYKECPAIRNL